MIQVRILQQANDVWSGVPEYDNDRYDINPDIQGLSLKMSTFKFPNIELKCFCINDTTLFLLISKCVYCIVYYKLYQFIKLTI